MTVFSTHRSLVARNLFLGLVGGWIASQSLACAVTNEAPSGGAPGDAESPETAGSALRREVSTPGDLTAPTGGSLIPAVQMFAGSALTTSRATTLAAAGGQELIRFYPCPEPSDACAMFEVEGVRGLNTYVYQVSSETCRQPGLATPTTAATVSSVRPRVASTARVSSSSSSSQPAIGGAQSNPVHAGTVIGAVSNEESFDCFGGYRVNFRARLENSIYAEPGVDMLAASYEYQLYDSGDWTPVATFTQRASSWYEGCTEWNSNQVLVLDSDGEEVMNETEVGPGGCAGSEPYTGDPAEDCKRVADSLDGLLSGLSDWLDTACRATTLITFTPDEVTFGYEQDGLSIGGTKNIDICGLSKAARETVAGIAEDVMILTGNETPWIDVYNSCLADPGWYMPSEYGVSLNPPQVCEEGLEEIFASPDEGSPTACADYVTHVAQDMGGGTVCDADVRFSCNTLTDGSCECKATEVVGDMVCTSS